MIKLDITMRHASLKADFEAFVREKVSRLEKFLRGDPRVEVVLDHEKGSFRCEMIVHASSKGSHMVAHVAHEDPRAAVDAVLEKMARQLSKQHDRRRDHRGKAEARAEDSPVDEVDEPTYEDIVKREIKGE